MREFPEISARWEWLPPSGRRFDRRRDDAIPVAGIHAQAHAPAGWSVSVATNGHALVGRHQGSLGLEDTILPWSGVLALAEDDVNYYLFIDAMQALVLPRAAIAPMAAEFEQFTRHLRASAI
jgi:hypothetical protein